MIGKQLIEEQEVFGQVTEGDDECHAIVFWTKDGPNNNSPSAIKIVFYFFIFLRTQC